MGTAIIGTGGLGSVIARRLASGGETLRLSSADTELARTLAAAIGQGAAAASGNRDVLQGADAVILALRFGVLKGVIEEIADSLTDKLVVVPSNPVGLDAQGNIVRLLPQRQSSGTVVAGWLPQGARLAMAFGSMSGDRFEASSNRSPELVLFYATDDERAVWQVEPASFAEGRAGQSLSFFTQVHRDERSSATKGVASATSGGRALDHDCDRLFAAVHTAARGEKEPLFRRPSACRALLLSDKTSRGATPAILARK
jgi:8-hydroxy-5-deazaflavin:NADPH oxidoreductase